MAEKTRLIGLSLGADICWPICYEGLLKELDLSIEHGGDTLRFDVERVSIEPFNLMQPCKYDVVIDRLTHWYHTSREWIKKSIVTDDLYVFNNPWTLQSMEKHTTYAAMMRLGIPVPDTWLIPPKSYADSNDLEPTLQRYAKLFDLGDIGDKVGYPQFIKPFDGGAWVGVTAVKDRETLLDAYNDSGTRLMHIQKGVVPFDKFVRCIGLGPQWRCVNYDPDAPLHDRYTMDVDFVSSEEQQSLEDITMIINAFFGWDFNSCESLLSDGKWHPIDFANGCPDSQVTSLHFHFPWLIKANLKWSIFCAATNRRPNTDLNWREYFDIADQDIPYEEKLAGYVKIARKRFDIEAFESFCAKHLSHIDEVADHYFTTDAVKDAIREKVVSLYPEHEVDEFTELFWNRIQTSRETERAAATS
ncbi:MAG: RimK family alpha-L-glutamate ligase [Gammaproteobacteria bacterium]